MTFRPELIDELLKEYRNPEDLMGEGGIFKQLTKALIERCLTAELNTHLQQEQLEPVPASPKNRRNGHSQKTIKGEFGEAEIAIPRDRHGEFEPILIAKGQTRFNGFDDKILSLYARGMTTRDIQAQLQDLYGVEVSHMLISNVTEAVEAERKLWQNRSLDEVYPIVYLDAIVVKVRHEGRVIHKAIHMALGVNLAGQKELLGMWMTQNESSKFWLSVLSELNNRGVKDIFIACVDGLTGFPEAIETVFPQTQVQLCIVHMVRNSLSYVSYKDRRAVAAGLKTVYGAATESEAELALVEFAESWDKQYPTISKSWMHHWERIVPFFAFPADIRKAIYTTNAIESMNMTLRKVLRNHRSFPTDESVMKVIYLAIHNIAKKWTMPIRDWKRALNRFAIEFEGRFPM
ncbi:IS256 family transposase [Phormidesmis priestleyi ULC007]|uniref:Mutator family transposase n=1 Tax=Phormidesmis priestleyi ULC007 TaxID=1920490 RepID=A0A2T1D023_9CYAN|nr:IS256 family transposase [Phormidesmis priestleyi]PSB13838.1 IS256 family transposase [Phormidesmis priestleyi ULC007]